MYCVISNQRKPSGHSTASYKNDKESLSTTFENRHTVFDVHEEQQPL
jgi:hypothetical protein